jgi:hypothetical protein
VRLACAVAKTSASAVPKPPAPDIYRHVRTGEMHEEHARFAPMNDNR